MGENFKRKYFVEFVMVELCFVVCNGWFFSEIIFYIGGLGYEDW